MSWSNSRDKELRARAEVVIPGGMYGHLTTDWLPDVFPQFFSRAHGARTWDADGNEYIDYMCAYGPNLLGYGFEPVEAAARAQQERGDTLSGPSEIMVQLAEDFVGMVSHADWAMFCKNGTDATSMAMVIARAQTGRSTILCARGAYHGAAPWCSPLGKGLIPEDRAHIVYYDYNDADSLADAFKAHDNQIAGVFATPFRHETMVDQVDPDIEYAQCARRLCDETGALLIVDDIRAGFRIARDCSWSKIGIAPDLSTWGKSLGNGYTISALLGSDYARAAAQEVFVTGTFWFSAAPMAAAIETLRQIRETDYLERMQSAGEILRRDLQQQAASHGFEIRQTGPVTMPLFLFEGDHDFRVGYGWVSECIKRGVYIHPYHNNFLSSAHTIAEIAATLEVTDAAFAQLKGRLGTLEPHAGLQPLLSKT